MPRLCRTAVVIQLRSTTCRWTTHHGSRSSTPEPTMAETHHYPVSTQWWMEADLAMCLASAFPLRIATTPLDGVALEKARPSRQGLLAASVATHLGACLRRSVAISLTSLFPVAQHRWTPVRAGTHRGSEGSNLSDRVRVGLWRHRYHRAGRWVRGCHRRCCRRCSRRGKRRTREHAMHNEQRVLRSLFVRVEHLLCGLVGGGRCLHVRSDGRWLLHRRRLLFQRRCRRSGMPAQRLRVALGRSPAGDRCGKSCHSNAGGPLNSGTRSNSFSARVICRRTPRRARNASQRETRP